MAWLKRGAGIAVALWCFSWTVPVPLLAAGPASLTWRHLSSATADLPAPMPGDQQTASMILDVDRDGVSDFIITERTKTPSVVWYRRVSNGWERYLIDDSHLRIEAGGAFHDVDSDGDPDLVFGGDSASNQVWWWENPFPNFDPLTPWRRRLVKDSGATKHHDQLFGDFDGDGAVELVFWNQRAKGLFLAEIPDNPRESGPWPSRKIFGWEGGEEHEGLAKADVNGDGTLDFVGGGNWYEHQSDGSFKAHVIDPGRHFTRAAAGQFKKGGWAEVVFVPGDADGALVWYEWDGTAWVGHTLIANVVHGHSIDLGDVDGDGNLDLFVAEMGRWGRNNSNPDSRMWVFYGDGAGNFTETIVATGHGNHESRLGDLDGDGDLDILGKPYNWGTPRVDVWLSGRRLSLDHWQRHLIDERMPTRAMFLAPGDLDGDGRIDIVAGAWWYKNPGAPGGTWIRRTIGTPLRNMAAVHDFDGDGDLDVLGTQGVGAEANADFVWARNDGKGRFTVIENVAKGDGDFLQGVAVARFKGNGPLEVALSWHADNRGVQMLTVPADPSNETWSWRRISPASQDEDLSAADLDGDGDLDLYQGTAWLENPSDATGDWPVHVVGSVTEGVPDRNDLVDLNGDGRLDAVVGLENGTDVLAFTAPPDPRQPWKRSVIGSGVGGGFSMDAADLDLDGDVDVVLGEHRGKPNRVLIYENRRHGDAWRVHVIDAGDPKTIDHHDGTQIVDLDGDGDLDLISVGWYNPKIWFYENKAITAGIVKQQ